MAASTEMNEEMFLNALSKHLPPIGTDITKTSLWPRVKPGHANAVQLAILVRQETQMRLLMRIEERLATIGGNAAEMTTETRKRGRPAKKTGEEEAEEELEALAPKTKKPRAKATVGRKTKAAEKKKPNTTKKKPAATKKKAVDGEEDEEDDEDEDGSDIEPLVGRRGRKSLTIESSDDDSEERTLVEKE